MKALKALTAIMIVEKRRECDIILESNELALHGTRF